MKLLTATISCLLLLSVSMSSAQDPIVAKRLKEIGHKFEQLPIEARVEYVKLKQKATVANKKQKYFTCLVAISDALHIFPDDMDLIWLRGICNAQIHNVDKAIHYYDEVTAINPNHFAALMNLVEINFFAGRYKEAVNYITKVNNVINYGGVESVPLVEFKHLISLVKLEEQEPGSYGADIKRVYASQGYMDDNPFYYYANALRELQAGNKDEGLIWILKAYLIFRDHEATKTWNKALVDTGFIGAHEIMFSKSNAR